MTYTVGAHEGEILTANTEYSFKLQAFKAGETSNYNSAESEVESESTKLSAPLGVETVPATSTSITVSWNEVTGATGYVLEWSENSDFSDEVSVYTTDRTYTVGDSAHEEDPLAPNTKYFFRVKAQKGEDPSVYDSGWSEDSEFTKLATPKIKSLTPESDTQISVSWDTIVGADHYTLSWGLNNTFDNSTKIDKTNDTSMTYTVGAHEGEILTANTKYSFKLQAFKEDGTSNYDSAESVVESESTKLSVPLGVETVPTTSTSITVSWNEVTGATGYVLEWSNDSDFSDEESIYTTGLTYTVGDSRNEAEESLVPNTKYFFRVKAQKKDAEDSDYDSGWSEDFEFTKLATPEITLLTPESDTQISVNWDAVNGTDHYILSWGLNNAFGNSIKIDKINDKSMTYTVGAHEGEILTANTEYSFKLQAFKEGETSIYDSVKSAVKSESTKLSAPLGVETVPATSTSITVSWNTVTGATGYVLEWSENSDFSDEVSVYTTDRTYTVGDSAHEEDPLAPNTKYFFRVKAQKGEDPPVYDSGWSEDSEFTKLATPKIKSLTPESDTQISVNWDAIDGADHYILSWGLNNAFGNSIKIDKINDKSMTYTVGAHEGEILTADSEYSFKLQAFKEDGTSNYDSAVSEVESVVTKLTAMTSFIATDVFFNYVDLEWSAYNNADHYVLQWSENSDFSTLAGEENSLTALAFKAEKLKANTEYYFRVKAITGNNETAWKTISETTYEADPTIVTTLSDITEIDGKTSLREAVYYANSVKDKTITITFAEDLANKTILLNDELDSINITRSMVIDGSTFENYFNSTCPLITIQASGYAQIFNVESQDSTIPVVEIHGIAFTGNIAQAYDGLGGAIMNNGGKLRVSECVFYNNTAEDGGAIYSIGDLIIQNSTFNKNRASSSGGAVYNEGGDLLIVNSTFADNYAAEDGGAVYIYKGDDAADSLSLIVADSTFTGNLVIGHGGAIANASNDPVYFINSIAVGNGISENEEFVLVTQEDLYDVSDLAHFDLIYSCLGVVSDGTKSVFEFPNTVANTFVLEDGAVKPQLLIDGTIEILPDSNAALFGTFVGKIDTDTEDGRIVDFWFVDMDKNQWTQCSNKENKKVFDLDNADGYYGLAAGLSEDQKAYVYTNAQNLVYKEEEEVYQYRSRRETLELFNSGAYALASVKLTAPEITKTNPETDHSILVSWKEVPFADSYIIHWTGTEGSGTQEVSVFTSEEGIITISLTGLPNAYPAKYTITVQACSENTYISKSDSSDPAAEKCCLTAPQAKDINTSVFSSEKITVTLSENPNTDKFNVRYRIAGSSLWSEQSGSGTSCELSGLTSDSQYEIQVQWLKTENEKSYDSDWSDSVNQYTKILSPIELTVSNTQKPSLNQYILNWDMSENSTANVSGYLVEYKRADENGWVNPGITVSGAESRSYTFTSQLEKNEQYDFRVSALANPNHEGSDSSAPIEMIAIDLPDGFVPTPGNWTISFAGLSPVEQDQNYVLYQGTDKNNFASASVINYTATINESSITLVHTAENTTETETAYFYWIQIVSPTVNVSPVLLTSETAVVMNMKTQDPVSDLTFTGSAEITVDLSWTKPVNKAENSGYTIWRSETSDFGSYVSFTVKAEDLSFEDTTVEAGTNYWYKIKVNEVSGYSSSEWSDPVLVLTAASQPAGTPVMPYAVNVYWTDTAGKVGDTYTVLWSTDETRPEITTANKATVSWKEGTVSYDVSWVTSSDTPLNPNTSYYIWVKADRGGSEDSGWALTTDKTRLEVPELTAVSSSSEITVSWQSGIDNVSGFAWRYRKTDGLWSEEQTISADQTSITVSDLSANTSYEFEVIALSENDPTRTYASVPAVKTFKTNKDQSLLVNTTEDLLDLEGNLILNDEFITLREAISNADGSGSTAIMFDEEVFDYQKGNYTIRLQKELVISKSLTIDASNFYKEDIGYYVTVAMKNSNDRVFNMNNQESTVHLDGLIISGGKTTDFGAGIYSVADLYLNHCTITENSGYKYGAGIYSKYRLTMDNTTVSGNTTSASGGAGTGIYALGNLTVRNSAIINNIAAGKLQRGAGIYYFGSEDENSALISDSRIEGNRSTGKTSNGGGIYNAGAMMIRSSWIQNNISEQDGGGIYNYRTGDLTLVNSFVLCNQVLASNGTGAGIFNNAGDLLVVNSTIAGNSSSKYGGGIANESLGEIVLYNSLVVNNWAKKNDSQDVNTCNLYLQSGSILPHDTLIGSDSLDKSDLFVQAPLFDQDGKLQNQNTLDLHLSSGSTLAIDRGNNENAAEYGDLGSDSKDIFGSARIVNGTIDIGTAEFQGSTALSQVSIDPYSSLLLDLNELSSEAPVIPVNSSWNYIAPRSENNAVALPSAVPDREIMKIILEDDSLFEDLSFVDEETADRYKSDINIDLDIFEMN